MPSRLPAGRPVRLGIVGAGQVARERHLPGFLALPGVEVLGVSNRRRDSAARVAREFGIPRVFETWEYLVEDPEIDAVVVAAWPYLHGPVTLAALDAGKHVLTEAPMAMNAREAHRMVEKAREHPGQVAMVVPSPYGQAGDLAVRRLLDDGTLGPLREVHVTGFSPALADPRAPLSWRQMARYSGFNLLNLGFLHQAAARWTPAVARVQALTALHVPARTAPETGKRVRAGLPDSVHAVVQYQGGAIGTYRFSGATWHAPERSIALFGARGSLVYDLARDTLAAGAAGAELQPVPLAAADRRGWSAEADFIAAIRGEPTGGGTDFVTGALHMQFAEAVARSARHHEPVELPLQEFSNPSL